MSYALTHNAHFIPIIQGFCNDDDDPYHVVTVKNFSLIDVVKCVN